MKKWKKFELLVEKIYKELEPNTNVIQDDKIYGFNSKKNRQIDVSIRKNIAGSQILIIVQAKDYSRKVDVNDVGNFANVIQDVKASKGVMICNKGFTDGAKNMAESYGIDLFSAHDVNSTNWKIDYKIPVLVREVKLNVFWEIEGNFSSSKEKEIFLQNENNPWNHIYSKDKKTIITNPLTVFAEMWNSKQLDTVPEVIELKFIQDNNDYSYIKCEESWIEIVKYDIIYEVKQQFWIKKLEPIKFRAFKNYHNGDLVMSQVEIDKEKIKPSEKNNWTKITNNENIPLTEKYITFYETIELISIGEEFMNKSKAI